VDVDVDVGERPGKERRKYGGAETAGAEGFSIASSER